jgi:hypothetical protein
MAHSAVSEKVPEGDESGGAAVLRGRMLRLVFHAFSLVVRNESLKIVAIRTIAPKSVFIEQALDAATGAYLVGTSLGTDRPTHLTVPAAP